MDIVETIIGIGVAFFIIAFLIPVAFNSMFGVNYTVSYVGEWGNASNCTYTNWSGSVITMWETLPVIGLVAILVAILLAFVIKKFT